MAMETLALELEQPWRNLLEGDVRSYRFFAAVDEILQGKSADTPLWFKTNPSLGFRHSDIESLFTTEASDEDAVSSLNMMINFIGLHGVNSPLPTFYTEDLLGLHEDEAVVRQFFDFFNHRIIELLYLIWKKYQVFYEHQGTHYAGESYLARVSGLEYERDDDRHVLSKLVTLLGKDGISKQNLQRALSVLIGTARVEVTPNTPRRIPLEKDSLTLLGGKNSSLSGECALGRAIESCEFSFSIRVWLESMFDFRALKERIDGWLDSFGLHCFDYDLTFLVRSSAVKSAELNGQTAMIGSARLGQDVDEEYIEIKL
ncbi:MAG: type VI secretion system baseplate subunit TssG [Gammaproteobacteria bacterium]|nr:type VI secretion system baseplate subunit TssG [Gammaproteobacteria bacterium]